MAEWGSEEVSNVVECGKGAAAVRKKTFYMELAYGAGLLVLAVGAALVERADFGMSMVVAPAYILHLKLSHIFPWFTFGVAEYVFQGLLILLTVAVMRRLKWSYLFSFVTALIYGTVLDGAMALAAYLPAGGMAVRLLWYILGMSASSFGVALLFHTYLAPEAYELVVKELSAKTGRDISRIKTAYDCSSVVLSIVLSFAFFGFGTFRGIGWGTVVGAVCNGFLISRFSKVLEHFFRFENKWSMKLYQ